MIAAFNHKYGTGFVGQVPLDKGSGQVLVVTAVIKNSDVGWLELVSEAKKFAAENKIEQVQFIEAA